MIEQRPVFQAKKSVAAVLASIWPEENSDKTFPCSFRFERRTSKLWHFGAKVHHSFGFLRVFEFSEGVRRVRVMTADGRAGFSWRREAWRFVFERVEARC